MIYTIFILKIIIGSSQSTNILHIYYFNHQIPVKYSIFPKKEYYSYNKAYLGFRDPKLMLLGPLNEVDQLAEPSVLVGFAQCDSVREHVPPYALHVLALF